MNIITTPKYNNKIKGKKCVICGEAAFSHLNGLPYCRKHYMQMKRGGIKERTTRDPNELVDLGTSTKIILYNKKGIKINQYGLIDSEDSDFIQGKRIGFGNFGEKEYCYINTEGRPILLHRYIWMKNNGDIPQGKVVDHINGNGLDCRKKNLRLASAKENSYNLSKDNKYTGVNPYGDRFNARIMYDRKDYNLGTFPTLKEALNARIDAERRFFGGFGPNVSRLDRGLLNYSTQQVSQTVQTPTYGRSDALLGLFPNSFQHVFLPNVYFDTINKHKGNTNILDEFVFNPIKGTFNVANDQLDGISDSSRIKDVLFIRARLESILGKDYFKDNPNADEQISRIVNSNLKLNDINKLRASRVVEGPLSVAGITGVAKSGVKSGVKKMLSGAAIKGGMPIALGVATGLYDDRKSSEMVADFEKDLFEQKNKDYVSGGLKNGRWDILDSSNVSDDDFKKYLDLISYDEKDKDFIEKIRSDLKSIKPKAEIRDVNQNPTKSESNVKSNNSSVLPLTLAGLALGGAYLWKKNKEEKEKKRNAKRNSLKEE